MAVNDNNEKNAQASDFAQGEYKSQYGSNEIDQDAYTVMDPRKYILKEDDDEPETKTVVIQKPSDSENLNTEQNANENVIVPEEKENFIQKNKQIIIYVCTGLLIGAVGLFMFSSKDSGTSKKYDAQNSKQESNVRSVPIKDKTSKVETDLGEFELTILGDKAFLADDYHKAARYYKKAAEKEYAEAQNKYGDCLMHGTGVDENKQEAVYWYEKAARNGSAEGMNNLGFCYEMGYGVNKNYNLAVQWYEKAVDMGLMNAQYNLADCYENGKGVPRDLAKAKQLYTLAYSQGHKVSGERLSRLNGIGENGYVRSGYITGDEVIMRSRPSTLGDTIGVLYKNNHVDVINVVECKDSTAAILESKYRLTHRGNVYALNENLGLKIIRDLGDKYECGFIINDEAIQAKFYKSDVRKLYGDKWYCVRYNGKLGYVYGRFVSVR